LFNRKGKKGVAEIDERERERDLETEIFQDGEIQPYESLSPVNEEREKSHQPSEQRRYGCECHDAGDTYSFCASTAPSPDFGIRAKQGGLSPMNPVGTMGSGLKSLLARE
jgi:hypothetical protein